MKWTLLVIRDDNTPVRQLRLSRELVRCGIAIGLIGFALLVTVTAQALVRLQRPLQTARLAQQNALLRSELDNVRGQVSVLTGTMDQLAEKDEQFRLIAGLEPLEAEVQRAGVGGPDNVRLERSVLWRLDRGAGARVFSTSGDLAALLRRARLLSASWSEAHDTLEAKYERLESTPSILPTDGFITSAFSRWRRHPILDRPRPHQGVDITARQGTPILAAANGQVRFVGYNGEYGLVVEIDHGFGYVTRYAHASRAEVRADERVERGDTIARVGRTGLAIGPHLHYEVLLNGKPVNPRQFLLDLRAVPD